jgi:hypothetical protein
VSNAKVNAMLDTMTPDLPEAIRYLTQNHIRADDRALPALPVSTPTRPRRRTRNRQMRERRTAYLMGAFGILLGSIELYIVLSYF